MEGVCVLTYLLMYLLQIDWLDWLGGIYAPQHACREVRGQMAFEIVEAEFCFSCYCWLTNCSAILRPPPDLCWDCRSSSVHGTFTCFQGWKLDVGPGWQALLPTDLSCRPLKALQSSQIYIYIYTYYYFCHSVINQPCQIFPGTRWDI